MAEMRMSKAEDMEPHIKVHFMGLMHEITEYAGLDGQAITLPIRCLRDIMMQIAQRAIELNDLQLNQLMMRLALYEVSDPYSQEYNGKLVEEYLDRKPEGEQ